MTKLEHKSQCKINYVEDQEWSPQYIYGAIHNDGYQSKKLLLARNVDHYSTTARYEWKTADLAFYHIGRDKSFNGALEANNLDAVYRFDSLVEAAKWMEYND